MNSVKDKTVLVTGGARGIGKGLAKACLAEGARVVITNLDVDVAAATVDELSAMGAIRAVRCDATDRGAVDDLFDDIWASEGPVDVAFSNAGTGAMAPILDMPMEEVHQLFATNFDSALNLAQSYAPRLIEADRPGHIMFTGSEHSLSTPPWSADLGFGIYGASKHAMLVVAEWLRNELQDTKVTVSVLMPGPVLTEGLAATFDALASNPNDPALRSRFSETTEHALRDRFISTEVCAEIALRGLAQGLFYIPAQPHIKGDVDARYRELSEAFAALGLADANP
jgi:NAD(P)-dependent dehydrogenase (short-subunit alcohol dehydrogenase family)